VRDLPDKIHQPGERNILDILKRLAGVAHGALSEAEHLLAG
jgi:hypothetical protein